MQRFHSALSAVGGFAVSTVLYSPVLSLTSVWLSQLSAGDALVVTFCAASIAVGAGLAFARCRFGGPAHTIVTLS